MQLTSFTDYGLRALIYMASLPQDKMTSISEVTEVYGVSRNHMVKIINQLSRVGFVTAVRAAWRHPFGQTGREHSPRRRGAGAGAACAG